MFEEFCEKSDNVKWFYKNGESADSYFSIVYENAIKHRSHICDKDNMIWIIET